MNKRARPIIAFLDTNALHYIYLYLVHAENQRLYPFSQNEDAVAEALEHLGRVEEVNFRESLEKGFATIECLAEPNVQAEYSSISELELMAGRAKGKAVVNAAREGVPDRMWGRLYDKEVGARLTTVDLTDIKARVEELSPTLERAGIPAAVSDQGRTRDVLDLAKGIAGLVYLGSADNVIFASALIARADFIITADEYFRKTINRIRSGQQPYDNIRRQVRTLIGQITLDAVADVTLPLARKISLTDR